MFRNKFVNLYVNQMVIICILLFSVQSAASAAMVSTPELIEQHVVETNKQQVMALLKQDHVQTKLIELGVNPADALQRAENMTTEEIQQLALQMDQLPAGSGVVGTVAFVFLVLLVTDILGFTDIFPFVKKTVR